MIKMPLRAFLASALLSAACAGDPAGTADDHDGASASATGDGALAFNDISILLKVPPAADRTDPRFADWLPRIRNTLIAPADLAFALAHGAAAPNLVDLQASYAATFRNADWRVVSVRLDPRFVQRLPDDPSTPGLSALRLVAQPLNADGTIANGALHLIYRADPRVVARALVALKAASTVPTTTTFGVHPGHAAEWETGEGTFNEELGRLLTAFCTPTNLISINLSVSIENPASGDTSTFYAAFLRNPTGAFAAISPPSLQDQPSFYQSAVRSELEGSSIVFPEARVADHLLDDLDPVLYPELNEFIGFGPTQSMLRRAYAIENPNRHTLQSTDCVSCHLSTPVVDGAEALLASVPSLIERARETRYTLLLPEQAPLARKPGPTSFRNFGWEPGAGGVPVPAISQRTVNETDRTLPLIQALIGE